MRSWPMSIALSIVKGENGKGQKQKSCFLISRWLFASLPPSFLCRNVVHVIGLTTNVVPFLTKQTFGSTFDLRSWSRRGWGVEATRLWKFLRQRKRSWSRLNSLLSATPEFDAESTCTASAGCVLFQVWKTATRHCQQGTRAGALDVVANYVVPRQQDMPPAFDLQSKFHSDKSVPIYSACACWLLLSLLCVLLGEFIETRDKGIV